MMNELTLIVGHLEGFYSEVMLNYDTKTYEVCGLYTYSDNKQLVATGERMSKPFSRWKKGKNILFIHADTNPTALKRILNRFMDMGVVITDDPDGSDQEEYDFNQVLMNLNIDKLYPYIPIY